MADHQLDDESRRLLQLGSLIQSAIQDFVACKRQEVVSKTDPGRRGGEEGTLPSKALLDAQRTLLAAAGTLTELVSEPQSRLVEVGAQYWESRALHIVVDKRVPDLLSQGENGSMHIKALGDKIGIEHRKLSRLMRCLCSIGIFSEVDEDVFTNNRISESIVGNEPLRAYILVYALQPYTCSDYLPRFLNDRVKGASYVNEVTPLQAVLGTEKRSWDWMEEKIKVKHLKEGYRNGSDGNASYYPGVFGAELQKALENASGDDDEQLVDRPEYTMFGTAMIGGGRVYGQAQLYGDFPWASLGAATIVDVGGGVGGFSLQLSKLYPDLNFIIQDRAPVLKQAETEIWPSQHPEALVEPRRVRFQPHDFFEPNPVVGADVYWLRYVLHDWSDEYCMRILAAIKPAMGPRSRILICDQVMNTTRGCEELKPAPAPLPANWGYYTRYSHQRDFVMMSTINGIERKPTELKHIIERAGLQLKKIWDCRSQVGLVEVVLPGSELD
ncbi:hypothetical protein SLS62_009694 [Diatrype stigma]|uniref:O-methyltransferase domain-containing protein n=1 Tax=Diatrype stigma TaxID=117547 RepID=A0AAN9YHZ5_9PEZI